MPLDRYSCNDCGERFEQMRSRSNAPVTATATVIACPSCGGESVELSFGLPAKPLPVSAAAATNCRGDGLPCGASFCGRMRDG